MGTGIMPAFPSWNPMVDSGLPNSIGPPLQWLRVGGIYTSRSEKEALARNTVQIFVIDKAGMETRILLENN